MNSQPIVSLCCQQKLSKRVLQMLTCVPLFIAIVILQPGCTSSPKTVLSASSDCRLIQADIQLALKPTTNTANVTTMLRLSGIGRIEIGFPSHATKMNAALISGNATFTIDSDHGLLEVVNNSAVSVMHLSYAAVFDDDPEAGEVAGQIHNHSVSAHISEAGVFLSDNAGWHPIWIDPSTGLPALIEYSVEIATLPDWSLVASGNPIIETGAYTMWHMPRPIDGMAVVGGQHVTQSRVHDTEFGPVEIVMQTTSANEEQMPVFLDAAEEYLDMYTPILGAFPYKRFSIIENFFSSGFAYPGFTVLGPRVIPMGERALAPGYLDHEMIHNWWGNGVYVDQSSGNWCEALTSYCANYYRRILDAGGDEDPGRSYRRGILMKLATDPTVLDNAPLDQFGVDPSVNRFVGYDKGSFIFMMLEAPTLVDPDPTVNRGKLFAALREFYETHKGTRASWDDLQHSIEGAFGESRANFFHTWVHEHTVPVVQPELGMKTVDQLKADIGGDQAVSFVILAQDGATTLDIDPNFHVYRLIAPEAVVPTIGGSTGVGGAVVYADNTENETIASYVERLESDPNGENMIVLGSNAADEFAALFARTSDPISFTSHSFTIGGETYDAPDHAILHTMQHPDASGRFITVYLANSPEAWSHLNYIQFYARDTTIIWQGRPVVERRTYEPSRTMILGK